MKKLKIAALAMVLSMLVIQPCAADDIGLNVDLGFYSAYVFRGWNVFQNGSQMDQNTMLAPSISYTIPGIGLEIGYWSAYQLNGANKNLLVDAGLGAEQDLYLKYGHDLGHGLSLTGIVTAYYFPAAKEKIAGTAHPLYIEPGVGIEWSGPVTVGFNVFYMAGIQDALEFGRYLYLNPYVGKSWRFTKIVGLDAALSLGYKLFNRSIIKDNRWDVGLTVGVPISLPMGFYVKPGAGVVWTNFDRLDVGDEIAAFGMVNVGVSL